MLFARIFILFTHSFVQNTETHKQHAYAAKAHMDSKETGLPSL